MDAPHPAAASPTRQPVSPLIRAMLNRDRGDLDPWLAGMNGLALAFLLASLGVAAPGADASRLRTEPALPLAADSTSQMVVELAALAEVPAEPTASPAEVPPAQEVAPATNPPAPSPLGVWRDLPELIDPVVVREPGRRPETRPAPAAASRPEGASRRPATAPAGSPAGSQNGGAAPASAIGGGRGSNPYPPYPAFARRDRLQGTVVVSIMVKNGAVGAVQVVSSSGSPALDEYAVGHVRRRWKWPATTSQTFTQPFRFVLK